MNNINDIKYIRNFAIIAHIDHGKSTLADRLIEYCGAIESREMNAQILDSMDIERERGITIKSQTVRLTYKAKDGNIYYLNLMDTPGHVDFSYEVSRCLAACEGSLLVVDSSQGVEAQTLSNVYMAIDNNHEIIAVLNKIDLPASNPDSVKAQIEDVIGIDTSDALMISAKNGIGIEDLLEEIVKKLPPPTKQYIIDDPKELKALLVDSWYDKYLGIIILIRIFEGKISKGDKIKFLSNDSVHLIDYVGVFTPKKVKQDSLVAGQVGFVVASIKDLSLCNVGDTIVSASNANPDRLKGFKQASSVVFCSLFPSDSSEFESLKIALGKLRLNDPSIEFETENSTALGFGFRCGFLGLLHLEIVQERLSREFGLELITTAPSVVYKIHLKNKKEIEIHNPADFPEKTQIDHIDEPWIKATIIVPEEFLGSVITLCIEKRGVQVEIQYLSNRIMVIYELPLNEVVFDFYDRLKSISKGYASFDFEINGYKPGDLVKLSILINGEQVDALSTIVHSSRSVERGRKLCDKLKDLIPRQLFQIAIQAAIGGKIVARENVRALRKDVLAKCYGGDVSRKKKLLEKQKAGKKRMQNIGKVDIPQSAFIEALKASDD